MDEKTQKERLEQELRFLKESYEAEVISKEEFDKGKERVEVKLNEISQLKENPGDIEKKEDEKTKNETAEEAVKETAKIKTERRESLLEAEEQKKDSNDKHGGKLFQYAAIFIILILAAFFSYSIFNEKKETKNPKEGPILKPLCSSSNDCKREGVEGTCLNPSTKDAKCEFKEAVKINVLILNGRKDCFNCDTERITGILEEWFGQISAKEIDYSTNEGKNLADKFDVRLLPAYILDENITKKPIFEQSKQIFTSKNGSYILSDDASGSTFYFKRENVPNKLELFVKAGDIKSIQAEKNLQEFLDTFKEVQFEKHFSDNLTKELGIKVYPTFLINNRVKFTGTQPAEVIKENFCKLNKLTECEKNLSKILV